MINATINIYIFLTYYKVSVETRDYVSGGTVHYRNYAQRSECLHMLKAAIEKKRILLHNSQPRTGAEGSKGKDTMRCSRALLCQ